MLNRSSSFILVGGVSRVRPIMRSLASDWRSYVIPSKENALQSNESESCATADVETTMEKTVV